MLSFFSNIFLDLHCEYWNTKLKHSQVITGMKIGLIKEGKIPPDTRVALTPEQCLTAIEKYPQIDITIQRATNRSYTNEEYSNLGLNLSDDMSKLDVLFGIKEVQIAELIPEKTYFFFSHTKKKQPYNQKLMCALIEKKVRMIDYEALTYDNGKRIIGFGFFAGVVGAHNALLTYGKKNRLFELKPAFQCKDMEEMVAQYANIKIPPIKIVVTGDGRVAHGIVHIMSTMNILEVSPVEFLSGTFDHPVYTRLYNESLYLHKENSNFERDDFHHNPQNYDCLFAPYLTADILINGIYWDAAIPRLFERSDVHKKTFNISVIADVTCDEDGSVPINLGSSTIADPVYGYNKTTDSKAAPYQNDNNIIDIMAVDNLPNELPRDASMIFGESIINAVLPELIKPHSEILDRATICNKGQLGANFQYLHDYAFPNERA